MTDAEWSTSTDIEILLRTVGHTTPTDRKVRLFNIAICRRFWDQMPEESREIVTESALLADSQVSVQRASQELCMRANLVVARFDKEYPDKQFPSDAMRVARNTAAAICYAVITGELWGAASYFWEINPMEKVSHADIIREIFINPFRPPTLHPSWLIPALIEQARIIYDKQDFQKMPALGDALEAVGCTDKEILNHCRGPGPHLRGCWVLDLVLGEE